MVMVEEAGVLVVVAGAVVEVVGASKVLDAGGEEVVVPLPTPVHPTRSIPATRARRIGPGLDSLCSCCATTPGIVKRPVYPTLDNQLGVMSVLDDLAPVEDQYPVGLLGG